MARHRASHPRASAIIIRSDYERTHRLCGFLWPAAGRVKGRSAKRLPVEAPGRVPGFQPGQLGLRPGSRRGDRQLAGSHERRELLDVEIAQKAEAKELGRPPVVLLLLDELLQ